MATVTGTLKFVNSASGSALVLTFIPKETPKSYGSNLLVKNYSTATCDSTGYFSATLLGGAYRIRISNGEELDIIVPSDSLSYSIETLIDTGTNVSTTMNDQVVGSSTQTLTASAADLTGIYVTLPEAGTYIVYSETEILGVDGSGLGSNQFDKTTLEIYNATDSASISSKQISTYSAEKEVVTMTSRVVVTASKLIKLRAYCATSGNASIDLSKCKLGFYKLNS